MTKLNITKYGRGPDLVLLHGWASSSKIWKSCIKTLSQHYRIWCVDLPGHGDNSEIKWDAKYEQGMELLATSLPVSCSIIAWSLGGLFAQLYTTNYTHRVTRLLLLASTPRFTANEHWSHGMPQRTFAKFEQQFTLDPKKTLLSFNTLQVLHTPQNKYTLRTLNDALSNQNKHLEKIAWGLDWLANLDLCNEHILIRKNIQMLHGELDQVVSINAAKQTASCWDNTSLTHFEKAGHAAFISHEIEFLDLVDKWMNS